MFIAELYPEPVQSNQPTLIVTYVFNFLSRQIRNVPLFTVQHPSREVTMNQHRQFYFPTVNAQRININAKQMKFSGRVIPGRDLRRYLKEISISVSKREIFRLKIPVFLNGPTSSNFPTFIPTFCVGLLIYPQHWKNSMVWVRERTIPTERPPLVGEVIANFCG
jgi:hypothetical protein